MGWVYYGLVTLTVRVKRVHLFSLAISVGDGGVASSGAGGPAACFEKLGKEGLAAGGLSTYRQT
jgi:hypothetical protein